MITNEIIHILCYAPLSFITYLVLGHMLKVPRKAWFSLLMTMLHVLLHVLYTLAVIQEIPWADLARTILQMSVVFIVPLFFSRRKRAHTILCSTLTMLASTVAELMALFTYSSLGGSFDAHIMTDPSANVPAYILMYVINLSFLLIFLWVIWSLWNRFVVRSAPKAAWYFMIFPLSQVIWLAIAEIYAITSSMAAIRYLYFVPGIFLSILADWLLFRSVATLTKQAADEERARWYEDLLGQQQNYYSYILADQEEASHIRHDMRNQIQTVYALIQAGDTDTAQKQLGELTRMTEQHRSFCRNRIVDALLHVKELQFRDRGIRLQCRCSVPEDLSVSGTDLCSLFSNLLDNAADGVALLKPPQKIISLSSGIEGNVLTVCCENPYSGEESLRPTHRSDGHGLGLTILEDLADRHQGEVKIQTDSETFRVTVWLIL